MNTLRNALVVIHFIFLIFFAIPGCSTQSDSDSTPVNLREVFKDTDFTFQFIRTAGTAPYGGADLDECLNTAKKITDGDIESWYTEWYALAVEVENLAERYESLDDKTMSRQAYVRAGNYYRTAGFFLSEKPLDPRIEDTWTKSTTIFKKAAGMFSPVIEYIEIPYESSSIPAYFYKGSITDNALPTIIVHQGFDGTKEETMPAGMEAQKRGYNCLIIDGPGQGEMIHNDNIPFRPDWENVITPVVDYLVTRPDVDSSRIALIGFSMAGYLAPRAATGEHRLAAVVANGGVFSVFEGTAEHWYNVPGIPGTASEFIDFIQTKPDEFNEIAYGAMEYSRTVKWSLVHGMYTFGVETPAEYFDKMSYMTLEGKVQDISCPTLVIDSENDTTFPGQPMKLYENLTCRKDFLMFTAAEGADLHCQAGAAPISWKKTFDWLDGILLR